MTVGGQRKLTFMGTTSVTPNTTNTIMQAQVLESMNIHNFRMEIAMIVNDEVAASYTHGMWALYIVPAGMSLNPIDNVGDWDNITDESNDIFQQMIWGSGIFVAKAPPSGHPSMFQMFAPKTSRNLNKGDIISLRMGNQAASGDSIQVDAMMTMFAVPR